MLAAVDPHWLNKLRFHLADFRATAFPARGLPCSVKLRPESGRFDREHSPHAYRNAGKGEARALLVVIHR